MSNILVTGASGQLGSEIREVLKKMPSRAEHDSSSSSASSNSSSASSSSSSASSSSSSSGSSLSSAGSSSSSSGSSSSSSGLTRGSNNYFFTDRNTLDITDEQKIKDFIQINKIDLIINCAAYTAVDKAEQEQKLANDINHKAVKYLATIAKEKSIKLIHISTDYIFDGKNYRPYIETDPTAPNSVYGKTKLDGEDAMISINPSNSIIIRTSWVYSSFGNNFVKTMLKLGRNTDELSVIFDQVGTPTYAKDLAKTILEIVPQLDSSVKHENDKVQIYHYSNEGVLSWYDFAKEIMKMAKINCKINPIETIEYPTPAMRPHYSLLNKSKIKKEFDITIPYWKDSLDECLKVLGERR